MNVARLQRLVTLKPGEGRPVALIVSVSFFVSAGLMIGQSGIEALFFDRYGVDKLPVMYLVLGATMFLTTIGYGGLLARLGRGRATIVIPLAMAALAVAGRVGLEADLAWVTPALWLLQGVGYFVLGLAVWGLAGIVTDTRQAKRFFPLIGAGGVLGYVVGGLVTKPLAAWLGTPNLLLVWVTTLVVAAVLGAVLLSEAARGGRRTGPEPGVRPLEQLTVGLRSVARSPLMRWLALGSILFSLLFFSLYLPFSRAATERYPSPDDLAGFFGFFFGLSTGVAFLLSLFVTNRLLGRFGVPTVLLVLPLLYVVAFGVLAIESSFAMLMVFRFAQVAWLQGGASASTEAVINTVPPDRRDQTRAFIYGGPTQVGTALAGVIALIGERALSVGMLYVIGLTSAVLATVAMVGVRRAYPRELVQALREGRPSVFGADGSSAPGRLVAEPFGLVRADASAVEVAVGALADRDARVRRVAATVLGDLDAPAATSGLLEALHDDDDDVRADAVRSLARSEARLSLADIMRLVVDPAPSVRLAAVQAFRSLGIQREATSHAVGPLMQDRDPFVRVSAVATLVEIDGRPAAVASLIELAGDADPAVRAAALGELARSGTEAADDVVLAGLEDPAPEARAAAARALATRALAADDAGRAIDPLVAATADEHEIVRAAACDGLEAIGTRAMDPLVVALGDPRRRTGALAALERMPLRKHEADVRRFAEALVVEAVDRHRLGTSLGGDGAERLLADSLMTLADRDAALALRAAAMLGGGTELRVAIDNLSVTDPGQRANALEVIESVSDRELVRPLLTMWEGGATSPIDRGDALALLAADPDEWIRSCAALVTSSQGGSMTQTLTTLSLMERVLFLRKVPLFSMLAPPDLEPIASIAREQAFAPGDVLATRGEDGVEMHIIVTGDVSVTTGAGEDGHVMATRSSGDAVGEMSLLTNEPRMATLVCASPVRVLTIDRPRFQAILRERPEVSLGVIRVLCRRLAEGSDQAAGTDGTGMTSAST